MARSLAGRPALRALLCLSWLAALGPLAARPQEIGPVEDPPESDDPGGSIDPAVPEEEVTLGQELLPYAGDPLALDSPDDYAPEELGTGPSLGADREAAVTGCVATGSPIKPLKISPVANRYFSYRGRTQVLVGVSADNGCHLELGGDLCNFTNQAAGVPLAPEQVA